MNSWTLGPKQTKLCPDSNVSWAGVVLMFNLPADLNVGAAPASSTEVTALGFQILTLS